MTIRRTNKKDLRPEELAAVTGGFTDDYGLCKKCNAATGYIDLRKNNGLCDECAASQPGGHGATGGW